MQVDVAIEPTDAVGQATLDGEQDLLINGTMLHGIRLRKLHTAAFATIFIAIFLCQFGYLKVAQIWLDAIGVSQSGRPMLIALLAWYAVILSIFYLTCRSYERTAFEDIILAADEPAHERLRWFFARRSRVFIIPVFKRVSPFMHALFGPAVMVIIGKKELAINPFAFGFEPRLLSEGDAGFESLFRLPSTGIGTTHRTPGKLRSKLRRAMTFPYTCVMQRTWLFMAATLSAYVSGVLLIEWIMPRPGPLSIALTFLPLGLVSGIIAATSTAFDQRFVYPGGLFIRRRFWSTRSRLRMYDHRDSLLIVIPTKDIWTCFVANDACNELFVCTVDEGKMLLRSWFTPGESLTAERLDDFK